MNLETKSYIEIWKPTIFLRRLVREGRLKTGCKVPRRSRNEISFGCKCSNFYSEWDLISKQFIKIL